MSNVDFAMQGGADGGGRPPRPPKQKKHSTLAVFVAALVALAVLGAVGYAGYRIYERFLASAEDYPGPGSGHVVVEIAPGDTLFKIGGTLKDSDVVASAEAFAEAAADEPNATSIAPGSYVMLQRMSGAGAVTRLMDPKARNEFTVLIQEGWRTDQTVARLSEVTGIHEKDFYSALKSEAAVPLPSWAKGSGDARVEGFLFPATYDFETKDKAKDILNIMVRRFNVTAGDVQLQANSRKVGYSPYEVLTIASLVQAEGAGDDYADIASAIYNRLDKKFWPTLGTNGRLDIDATINYIFRKSELNFTDEEKRSTSPYNTYVVTGLPPTPINSPGEKAISAALNPTKSDWLYWVHGPDGQTCMAATLEQHEANIHGKCAWE